MNDYLQYICTKKLQSVYETIHLYYYIETTKDLLVSVLVFMTIMLSVAYWLHFRLQRTVIKSYNPCYQGFYITERLYFTVNTLKPR